MGRKSTPGRNQYTQAEKRKVWMKAMPLDGHPPDIWRRDAFGNVINWQEYGNPVSKYGWEIISDNPGSDAMGAMEHLQPIHCRQNNT